MELLTENEARTRVRSMIESREWWVIPWLTETAGDLSWVIEQEFYRGAENADFVVVAAPVSMSFARKSRCPVRALAGLMVKTCPSAGLSVREWRETLQTQDVLVAVPRDDTNVDRRAEMVRTLAWHDWVMGAAL